MQLHEGFCLRNNIKCERCGRVFKKGSEEIDNHWHCDLCDKVRCAYLFIFKYYFLGLSVVTFLYNVLH